MHLISGKLLVHLKTVYSETSSKHKGEPSNLDKEREARLQCIRITYPILLVRHYAYYDSSPPYTVTTWTLLITIRFAEKVDSEIKSILRIMFIVEASLF